MIKTTISALFLTLMISSPALAQWEKISGQNSRVRDAQTVTVVVDSAEKWKELWSRHSGEAEAALPEVDFSREMIVAVFLGERSRGGVRVELILQADPTDSGTLFVLYREVRVSTRRFTIEKICQPFEIRRVAKLYKSVLFEPNGVVKALE